VTTACSSHDTVELLQTVYHSGNITRPGDIFTSSEEPDEAKACPEPVEGSHVRFWSGGGVADRPADHD
jgi:hypothetical protein